MVAVGLWIAISMIFNKGPARVLISSSVTSFGRLLKQTAGSDISLYIDR
jgi:hypothetical protein